MEPRNDQHFGSPILKTAIRILNSLILGFRFRNELGRILAETQRDNSILSLDPVRLKTNGIAALALDFDGVLSPHGFSAPIPPTREWLSRCTAIFGEEKIFILSNKPTEARKRWFSEHFPRILIISGVAKKPYPDGLIKIGELARVPLHSILMVDDRLLTGCLAAINAGTRCAYIRNPYISQNKSPLTELFFFILRAGERFVVKLIS
jgi:predicted HAD superfamily phosphohydrolase YqeG